MGIYPAAKMFGPTMCPKLEPIPLAHVGLPVIGPGSPDVFVHGLPAVRTGDMATCCGPDPVALITTGASNVFINKRLAAVLGSRTAHGGVVLGGHADVLIGTETAGATFGDPAAATKACEEAAKTRRKGRADASDQSQGYPMNCGQEATRQLCIQNCRGTAGAGDTSSLRSCSGTTSNEEDWYADFVAKEKGTHDAQYAEWESDNEKARAEASARNDAKWAAIDSGDKVSEKKSGEDWFRPSDSASTWHPYEGKTLYKNHKPVATFERLPAKVERGDASKGTVGSFADERRDYLEKRCGVSSTVGDNTTNAIAGDLANGHTDVATVDMHEWLGGDNKGNHVVTVTQMQYGPDGKLQSVTVNDTGDPSGKCCGKVVDGAKFDKSLVKGATTNVV